MLNDLPYDQRVSPLDGTTVNVVASRQKRPNLPSTGCPFCVGGLEAPDPYDVFAFPNRWPALGPGRCEVVLYTPDHDATFAALPQAQARKVVDLWADRTTSLREQHGSPFVLIFENRGPEVGATIAHPHGQIYAFDHVPKRPAARFAAGWVPEIESEERLVIQTDHWRVMTEYVSVHPLQLVISPIDRIPDLVSAPGKVREDLASVLVDLNRRLDTLYKAPLPYMMWINQAPATTTGEPDPAYTNPWLHIELASPWRSAGVARFIAAAEVATEEYFNPVVPEDIAASLRTL